MIRRIVSYIGATLLAAYLVTVATIAFVVLTWLFGEMLR